jgi:hypothetical protein
MAFAFAVPSLLLQEAGVFVTVAVIAEGCVIETVCEEEHPLESVTVTEKFPADKLVAAEEDCPLLHK